MKINVSEHRYTTEEDDQATFEVYYNEEGWFWSFSPVWRDAGPFKTEQEAINAGIDFIDENGKPYIQLGTAPR